MGRAAAFLWGYILGIVVMALLVLGLLWYAIQALDAPPYCTRTPAYVGRGLRQCRPQVPQVHPPGVLHGVGHLTYRVNAEES